MQRSADMVQSGQHITCSCCTWAWISTCLMIRALLLPPQLGKTRQKADPVGPASFRLQLSCSGREGKSLERSAFWWLVENRAATCLEVNGFKSLLNDEEDSKRGAELEVSTSRGVASPPLLDTTL